MKLLRSPPVTLPCLTDLELNLVRILGGEGGGHAELAETFVAGMRSFYIFSACERSRRACATVALL